MIAGFFSRRLNAMNTIENVLGTVLAGLIVVGTAMIDVSDPLIVTAGTAMIAGLTGALKVLWDRANTLANKTDIALAKCEEEHQKAAERVNVLFEKVITLNGEVGMMKGRIQGFQEATDKADAERRSKESHSTP